MPIRLMRPEELRDVQAMMHAVTSEDAYDFSEETVFVWERDAGGLGGFLSLSLRPWAQGCSAQPVPFVEGFFVAAELRRTGVGRALVEAAETWCRAHGFDELGSDVDVDNEISLRTHAALGFEATVRVQYFRKRL